MRKALVVLVAIGLVYCSDPTGPDLPVGFGILSGDGQVVEAGRDSTIEPVVGQAYEDESGRVAWRFGTAALHAQTAIGTGVAGVPTCAARLGEAGMEPWQTCRETDAEGFVRYWFQPGTIATDSSCAEIRATVDSARVVLATVCSEVIPGSPASGPGVTSLNFGAVGDTLDTNALFMRDAHRNLILYRLVAQSGPAHVLATAFDNDGSRVFVADEVPGSGDILVVTEYGDSIAGTWASEIVANGDHEVHVSF